MEKKSSLFFLPPNLTNSANTPLFPHIASVLDQSLDLAYFSEINKLKNLYNPTSQFYDTDYILDLLGQDTLKNLLSDVTDKISLTMILSDIQNIKGTKKAFYAILELLKIQYKTVLFTQLATGCTEATIIFEKNQRINLSDVTLLEKFAQEVFPLCLSLTGITNCITYDQSMSYTGFNSLNLGMHFLDTSFTLDMSKMDTSYGIINSAVSNTIALLICNSTEGLVDIASPTPDVLNSRNTYASFTYGRGLNVLLDMNLVLDRFSEIDYNGFDTLLSRQTQSQGIYTTTDIAGVDTITTSSRYQFILDTSMMDISPFAPLSGFGPQVTVSGALDRKSPLDLMKLDTNITTTSYIPSSYALRPVTGDVTILDSPVFDTKLASQKLRLDYSYNSASSYIPMLNI